MREKIIEMLDIVLANEGLSMEIDNDIYDCRVSTHKAIKKAFPMDWEMKQWSDSDTEDCDGTLEQGIYYLKSITHKEAV